MTKRNWWHSATVYQIYPRSFCDSNGDGIGDLQGIIGKLDYLAELGVELLWLSPVFASPMADMGYDISDYYDIAPEYGTLADMEELISQARSRGILLLLDLVVHHTSDEHPWFLSARQDRQSPYRDYYIWRGDLAGKPYEGLQSIFGGSAFTYNPATDDH